MSNYENGYKAGRAGKECDPKNPKVNEWFIAGWHDGKNDREFLKSTEKRA